MLAQGPPAAPKRGSAGPARAGSPAVNPFLLSCWSQEQPQQPCRAHVDQLAHVVRLALAQLLAVQPLRGQHAARRVLRIRARHHHLRGSQGGEERRRGCWLGIEGAEEGQSRGSRGGPWRARRLLGWAEAPPCLLRCRPRGAARAVPGTPSSEGLQAEQPQRLACGRSSLICSAKIVALLPSRT